MNPDELGEKLKNAFELIASAKFYAGALAQHVVMVTTVSLSPPTQPDGEPQESPFKGPLSPVPWDDEEQPGGGPVPV